MPQAPDECPNQPDLSKCRIVITGSQSLNVQQTAIFDGRGMPIGTPSAPKTLSDCLCNTCGLMWTEEASTPVRSTVHQNVRRPGGV